MRSPTTGGRTARSMRPASRGRSACWCRSAPRVSRVHADPQQFPGSGRIYRKIAYGPLLDVFLIDMRSYRDPERGRRHSETHPLLGANAWLKRELVASDATWKVIAADMPIGLVSEDAVARGDGPPEGRENEIAALLSFMKRNG